MLHMYHKLSKSSRPPEQAYGFRQGSKSPEDTEDTEDTEQNAPEDRP